MHINPKIREAIGRVLDWAGFGIDWVLAAFSYTIVCTFMAYMATIIWTLWEKTPDNHSSLIFMFAICFSVGFWETVTKRRKKMAEKAEKAAPKKTASLSKADALTIAGAIDFLSATCPDYYNSAELQEARHRLQAAIDDLDKAKTK